MRDFFTIRPKPNGNNYLYFITITVFLIILILIITVAIYIFIIKSQPQETQNRTEPKITQSTQETELIKNCLETDKSNLDCNLIFTGPSIENKCKQLTTLKDKCFYRVATMNLNQEQCAEITNENLRQNCEMNSHVAGDEFHE